MTKHKISSRCRQMSRGILVVFLFIPVLLLPQISVAGTLALLVGVSGYPAFPEYRRLQGPRNDVQVMRQTLVDLGVEKQRISVLADGVVDSEALPTRANILSGLGKLAQVANTGDWVVIYLSGHGSQQPQLNVLNGYREPDGLDEIFLPYDVARWNGKTGRVENAIADDEIGAALDKIKLKGASIWAIFDTCHAGDMVRGWQIGEDAPKLRYIPPGELGIPHEVMRPARRLTRSMSTHPARGKSVAAARMRPPGDPLIAFYASQPDEPAPEETFPTLQNRAEKNRFGLFTYYLVEEIQNWQEGNFKTLAERVGNRYRQDKRAFPTPLFTGGLELRLNFKQQPEKD